MKNYGDRLQAMIDNGAIPMTIPLSVAQLEFPPKCNNCNDTRSMFVYVREQGGPYQTPRGKCSWLTWQGKTGWFPGKLEGDGCPACSVDQRPDYLRSICGLSGKDLDVMISGFRTDGSCLRKKSAHDLAAFLLSQNQSPEGFVTYWGGYGVGKSHLLKSICNGFRLMSIESVYTTLAEMMDNIRKHFTEQQNQMRSQELIDWYQRVKVLCVDEIDKVNLTDWTKETLFRIMDARQNKMQSLLTVMAVNVAPKDLPNDLAYLSSRMMGGNIQEVGDPDMRPAQAVEMALNMDDD